MMRRLLARWSPARKPAPAPVTRLHAVHVTPHPDGCDLDVEPYLRATLRDLLALLADRPALMDALADVIDGPRPTHDPYLPDRSSRDDVLIEQLMALLPTTIRQHQPELAVLAGTLSRIARRPLGVVPGQRGGEAA